MQNRILIDFTRKNILLALLALAASGCGAAASINSAPQIIGGETLTTNPYPIVALLKRDSQNTFYSFCSGTLIGPRTVVTAGHCSVDENNKPYDPASVAVVAGSATPEDASAVRLPVAAVIPHEDFSRDSLRADGDDLAKPASARDIAVWQLKSELTGAVTADAGSLPLTSGAVVTAMGFGQKSMWESPFTPHTLSRAQIPYTDTVKLPVPTLVTENGRSVRRTVVHEFPGRTASEFYAGGPHQPDTCKGDSGGGVFLPTAGGRLALIGVTSRGALTCDRGGVYTLVEAYHDWLARFAPW